MFLELVRCFYRESFATKIGKKDENAALTCAFSTITKNAYFKIGEAVSQEKFRKNTGPLLQVKNVKLWLYKKCTAHEW